MTIEDAALVSSITLLVCNSRFGHFYEEIQATYSLGCWSSESGTCRVVLIYINLLFCLVTRLFCAVFKFCSIFFTGNFTDKADLFMFSPAVPTVGPKTVVSKLVVLSGDTVNMTCNLVQKTNISWHYFNHTLNEYHCVWKGPNLVFKASVENSGKYLCSYEPKEADSNHMINLTVVGKCVLP